MQKKQLTLQDVYTLFSTVSHAVFIWGFGRAPFVRQRGEVGLKRELCEIFSEHATAIATAVAHERNISIEDVKVLDAAKTVLGKESTEAFRDWVAWVAHEWPEKAILLQSTDEWTLGDLAEVMHTTTLFIAMADADADFLVRFLMLTQHILCTTQKQTGKDWRQLPHETILDEAVMLACLMWKKWVVLHYPECTQIFWLSW